VVPEEPYLHGDPQQSLDHPESSSIWVFYHFFYPYNRGKSFADTGYIGNHVADIELIAIRFDS
jgi:hypothetical protein